MIPRPTPYFAKGLLLAALVFAVDQFSKFLLVEKLAALGAEGIPVLSFFKLVMVWNYGISFGMFADGGDLRKYVLVVVALGITFFLLGWLWRANSRRLALALALVVGGALGNVVDRFRWGAVADFFYFYYGNWYWPAFNIADSAIFIGVVLLCWESIVNPEKKAHPAEGKSGEKDDIQA